MDWENTFMINQNRKYLFIIASLLLAFLITYALLLPDMPFYGDEIGNARRMLKNQWHLFDLYRFYRIIGISVNILAFKLFGANPQVMTLFLAISVLLCLYIFSNLFSKAFASANAGFSLMCILIFLALPFSYYLLLLRVVFHEMLTNGLVLLCFMTIYNSASDQRKGWQLWLLPIAYGVSLFCYESSLLLPIAMALFAWFANPNSVVGKRAIKVIIVGSLIAVIFYLSVQFFFYDHNPKLSVSANDYASYNIGLNRFEQILRAFLLVIYNFRWSAKYLLKESATLPLQAIIGIAIYLITAAMATVYIIRKGYSVDTAKAKKAIVIGGAIALSSVGLWSYYWIIKRSIILPPLYNLYIPAIGLALAGAAGLSLVQHIRLVTCVAGAAIMCGIILNLILVLSTRTAITNVSAETGALASEIRENFGQDIFKYKAIVLPTMNPDGDFARKKARFESMLRQKIFEEYGTYYNGLLVVVMKHATTDQISIILGSVTLPLKDVLILDRKAGKLIENNVENLTHLSPKVPLDPFGIDCVGYRLEYNLERGDVVLYRNKTY